MDVRTSETPRRENSPVDKMQRPKKSNLSRTSSRSKVNLADLRISPLTTKKPELPRREQRAMDHEISEGAPDLAFARSHSSYLQGKSAPTTPGILSRSSSRKHLGGGLSRQGSDIYDDVTPSADTGYEYAGVVRDEHGGVRIELGHGQLPKAKSEAALLVKRNRLASQKGRVPKHVHPRAKSAKGKTAEDDWLTRTGSATNALLQESKGQSWYASSTSLTQMGQDQSTDEEDEGYEEMAALSAAGTNKRPDEELGSPLSTRANTRWGSRYGSRTASRRTSRRGSFSLTTGSRTPVAGGGQEGYFDEEPLALPTEPHFIDADDEHESHDEATVAKLTESRSFGLGGIVDRLMNFNLFKVEEREESATEDDTAGETEAQAKERMERENKRRREEKEQLVNQQQTLRDGVEGAARGEGGWSDAAWLLSVASKAMF